MSLFRSRKTLTSWLEEYALSHQNLTNKKIHWFCVPAIFYSIIGMLRKLNPMMSSIAIYITLFLYFRISIQLMLVMAFVMTLCMHAIDATPVSFSGYLTLFIIAWIGQFIGHFVFEGKKPAFLKDLQFLLIGPVWVEKTLSAWLSNEHSNNKPVGT